MSAFDALLGSSESMQSLKDRAARVAGTPLAVLIQGETGTGKEVLARAIHDASGRSGAFVAVDCAALAKGLVESELFGHTRGAFTGANRPRQGLVAAAADGTLFFDEVADLPAETQTRLLRLVQEGTWRPVGADAERSADLRIIAATWKPLTQEVRQGRFRADLYHRLAVVELHLPPLRDRQGDILELAHHFLTTEARAAGRTPPRVSAALQRALCRMPWSGNVRELRNTMAYLAVVPAGAEITPEDLPGRLRGPMGRQAPAGPPVRIDLPYLEARRVWLDSFQVRYVTALLEEHGGNVSAAARAAHLDRRTIQRVRRRLLSASEESPDGS